MIGFGWTGAIICQELTDAGLNVLALERGNWRDTPTDFSPAFIQDELRYRYRDHLFEEPARQTLTFRNNPNETALPMRELGSFLPGTGVGGSGIHWNGQVFRFLPYDFEIRSQTTARYGAPGDPPRHAAAGLGRHLPGARALLQQVRIHRRHLRPGRQPQGPEDRGRQPVRGAAVRALSEPADEAGHRHAAVRAMPPRRSARSRFPAPSANMSRAYTNPLGVQLGPCTYCGFCEKYACGNYSKACAQTTILPVLMRKPNFTLKTQSEVLRINLDNTGKRAVSVTYVDPQGEEYEQPAELIVLGAFILNNVHLLLTSGIGTPYDPATGKGTLGKNYGYQLTPSRRRIPQEDQILNPFVGAGALGHDRR